MGTSLTKLHRVFDDDDLTLHITIGHAQIGKTNVYLADQELVPPQEKKKTEVHLGTAEVLRGKMVCCVTVVADVREETDKTSVTYELMGGQRPFSHTSSETVDASGEVIVYTATIRFY